ncbi:MAG: hypothetical protein NXI16_05285 [Alphaproteobacteria bacterium]|nr:hypothetical protein [Alphaproteobacteria bacterium]
MATINILSWNIEVFGPQKYGNSVNNYRLVRLIAIVGVQAGADILALMELSSSTAEAVCYSVCEALAEYTEEDWRYYVVQARPQGDRESYGIIYRTGGAFAPVLDGHNNLNAGLSTVEFPCNWFNSNGRRAAVMGFRTTDTNNNFAVSVYHAPPNTFARNGLQSLAMTPEIYAVDNAGANQAVYERLLCGDYNLDVNSETGPYQWLTDAAENPPAPPADDQHGAGTTAMTTDDTHIVSLQDGRRKWGDNSDTWPTDAASYLNLQLDNIFYASTINPDNAAGTVIDLVAKVMDSDSLVRGIVQNFDLVDGDGNRAFPNADCFPDPLNQCLDEAIWAWLIVRYGISDHYPLHLSIDL